jgi:hypothetical protein
VGAGPGAGRGMGGGDQIQSRVTGIGGHITRRAIDKWYNETLYFM